MFKSLFFCLFFYSLVLSHAEMKTYPTVSIICGVENDTSHMARNKAIQSLGKPLSDSEEKALIDFLHKKPAEDKLTTTELDSLKNDVVCALLNQPGAPGDLHRHLMTMYYDVSFDPVWRDYCIQFLGQIYPKLTDQEDKVAVRKLFQAALKERKDSFAGTALLALKDLSALPDFKADEIAASAMELLRDKETVICSRVTALQVATILKHPEALAEARKLLAATETGVPLKMSAISTIGQLGSMARDGEALQPYTRGGCDVRLAIAARAAMARLSSPPPQAAQATNQPKVENSSPTGRNE